ncbi:hypothetical protein [Haloferula chungangensis]|uniref:hypothetical protein n=1 Tax=Haloferula chungangensis TaxID=1048331 RepID=UPI0036D3082C
MSEFTKDEQPMMPEEKLVDANGLLDALFDSSSRPSVRWLYGQKALGRVPCVRVGGRVFYSPTEVRATLIRR